MSDSPQRIVVAGDTHANTGWTFNLVHKARKALAGEDPRIVLQAGDFGFWPRQEGGRRFLITVDEVLDAYDMELWWVDGNHEDHAQLAMLESQPHPVLGEVKRVGNRIIYLPRGTRWTWHGKTWIALGGAVSIDKDAREEGWDWFPEEALTLGEVRAAVKAGPADVLVSHDAPASVPLPLSPSFLGKRTLADCVAHRELLEEARTGLGVSHVFHGHYHNAYIRDVAAAPRDYRATGLACDAMDDNWLVLDLPTMMAAWEGR